MSSQMSTTINFPVYFCSRTSEECSRETENMLTSMTIYDES